MRRESEYAAMRWAFVVLTVSAASLAGCTNPSPPPAFDIGMVGVHFVPVTFTTRVGERVTWYNNGTVPHTVTSDDPAGPMKSDLIDAGKTYSVTFTAPGNYTYHCVPHAGRGADGRWQGMVGTIVVTP